MAEPATAAEHAAVPEAETLDGTDAPPPAAAPPGGQEVAPDAAPASAPASEPSPSEPPSSTMLGDRYVISGQEPLPEFGSPSAKAYAASDTRDSTRKLFALICTPGLPPRMNLMKKLYQEPVRGVLPLADWGVVDWSDHKVLAIIYERPLGGHVMTAIEKGEVRITEYDISRRIVEPVVKAITAMQGLGFAHRAIRPDNLYFMDTERSEAVLGDCISVPPGFDQPAAIETIDRCTASPAGRGEGGLADDLYALAVTMAFVLQGGRNPLARLDVETLFKHKVERGSYATICGRIQVPLTLLEPIRGLLNDDEQNRWGLDELDLWINGRKQTPMQRRTPPKSELPYVFGGREHVTARTLAYGFAKNPAEAYRTLRSDETLDNWLRKNLGDEELADRIKVITDQAKVLEGSVTGDPDVVIARVCLALDPTGPIRYKGLAFMADGIGPMIAVELVRKGDAQVPAEVLQRELTEAWFKTLPRHTPDHLMLQRDFVNVRNLLKANDAGYGIERCLYELNPGIPCQSPLIVNEYVAEIDQLLPALDRVSNHVDTKSKPVDRHVAAFVAARFGEDIQPHLRALAAAEEETRLIGMLSLLAFLQWKLKTPALFGLASWIGGLLGPAINTYHSRTTRREIEREIPQLVRKGSLPELFDLIDNAEKRRTDTEEFRAAQAEFATAETEIREIEGDEDTHQKKILRTGQKAAAMVSILTGMLFIMVMLLVEMI